VAVKPIIMTGRVEPVVKPAFLSNPGVHEKWHFGPFFDTLEFINS